MTDMQWGGAGTTPSNAPGGRPGVINVTVKMTLGCGGVTANVRVHFPPKDSSCIGSHQLLVYEA